MDKVWSSQTYKQVVFNLIKWQIHIKISLTFFWKTLSRISGRINKVFQKEIKEYNLTRL
jgi:pyridoxine/pyridoxamine 5'-phosphate oxidase